MSTFRNKHALYVDAELGVGAAPRTAQRPWLARTFVGADLEAMASLMTPMRFSAGQVLSVAGETASNVYLLEAGAVTVSVPLPDGETTGVQIACPGDMLGLDALFAKQPASTHAVALAAGAAMRLAVPSLEKACHHQPELSRALAAILARQTRALQMELACCRHHKVERRLARLLLTLSGRLGTRDLPLTQEQLASILGVQRTTVTSMAGRLKEAGAVTYLRGVVRVVDAGELAAFSCECCAD